MAATLGALLTGLLASKAVNPAAADGSLGLMGWQAVGVLATLAWSGVVSFVLYKVVGLIFPLRSEEQDEWSGMDAAESGERGYIHAEMDSTSSGTVAELARTRRLTGPAGRQAGGPRASSPRSGATGRATRGRSRASRGAACGSRGAGGAARRSPGERASRPCAPRRSRPVPAAEAGTPREGARRPRSTAGRPGTRPAEAPVVRRGPDHRGLHKGDHR